MAEIKIGQPDVLVKLPRSGSNDSRALFSQVYSLTSTGKRRRQEICAAVGGDSVSVYEVQRGKTITSHVVPPDSTFSCAPLSIRIKTEEGGFERATYCVTKRRNRQTIQLFRHNNTQQTSLPIPTYQLEEEVSPVIHIDILPDLDAVVVLFKNGCHQLITANLDKAISHGQLNAEHKDQTFAAFTCLSMKEASRSVLKARPDIIAAVHADSYFLCGLARCHTGGKDQATAIRFQIWACASTTADTAHFSPVLSHELSCNPRLMLRDQDTVTFSSRNTQVIIRSTSRLVRYDVSKILPQLTLDLPWSSPDQTCSIEVADNLLLCSNSASTYLYNVNFRSVQAANDLPRGDLKRKRADPSRGPTSFVTYFPGLKRAIATRKNYILALDLEFPQSSSVRVTLQKSSTLLSNIGKGVSTANRSKNQDQGAMSSLGTIFAPSTDMETWQNTVLRLDTAVAENDPQTFQETFLDHVGRGQEDKLDTSALISDLKIIYVLSKVFRLAPSAHAPPDTASVELSVNFGNVEFLHWLSLHGHMIPRKILAAFPSFTTANHGHSSIIASITNALISWDPSLSFLQQYLASTPLLETTDLCRIVRVLLDLAMVQVSVQDGFHGKSDGVAAHAQQQSTDLSSFGSTQSQPNSATTAKCLVLALRRLSSRDDLKISAVLKSTYKQQTIVALIQFLRQQLFRSGSTRSMLHPTHSNLPATIEEPQNTLSVHQIAVLLSCCIDAVGPLALVSAGADVQFVHTIIPDLSSEITLAAEASEDAVFLQGILRETLRFLESTQDGDRISQDASKPAPVTPPRLQEPGTIHTIYSESASDGAPFALPTGLRAEGKIRTTKARKGGGGMVARSRREMGMLQDRLRGPYSLERLVL